MKATPTRRFVTGRQRACLVGLCALLALTDSSRVASQAGQTIGGYELVSELPVNNAKSLFTYRATLTNTAGQLSSATATGTASQSSGIAFTDNTLSFGPVGPGGTVRSTDTFAFIANTKKANPASIVWNITAVANRPPIANAGPDQTKFVTETAQLNGSASNDPDGNPLTYAWSFVSRPPGSLASLVNPGAVNPTFVVDRPGSYVVGLVVNDGFASAADTVTVTTANSAPVANAGPDQSALVTQTVTLNASGSSDVDGNTLTFAWSFVSQPSGSAAVLTNPTSVTPTFPVDAPGTYVVALVVNDGALNSAPDTVSITTQNSPPVANAGPDQTVFVASTATLDGSASTDIDGNLITYSWSLTSVPAGSTASLSNPTVVRPTFAVDRPGTYVAQLTVNDGVASSAADTVTITTLNSRPVANAGPDQSARTGQLIPMDGFASSDVDGDPLTFRWSFTSVPPGSTATLIAANSAGASFVLDIFGTYIVQLIVNDGVVDSEPDTVTITTTNSAPAANAGSDQFGVLVGTPVTLDGTQSSDPDNQPLTFSWSLITRPAGSGATLNDATTALPTFAPDVAGDYVAQLIVNDGFVDSAPDTVLITANTPPVANAGPDQQVIVGTLVQLDGASSIDPDGNPISFFWEFTSMPPGSTASLQNATTAAPDFVADVTGDFVIRLTVTDSVGATSIDTATVMVSPPGATAPIVTLNPVDLTIAAGQTATFTAAAAGAPVPTVQWQSSTDGGVTFDDVAGATASTLSFPATPLDNTKRYRAVFSNVAGGAVTTAATLTVTVNTIDEPVTVTDTIIINGEPLLAPLVDQTVDAGTLVTFTASAVDPGDTLVFSLINAPAGAVIDPLTGAFSWTPTVAQSPGAYLITAVVTDSGGLFATRTITITVRPFVHAVDEAVTVTDTVTINGAPLLAPLVDQTVDAGTLVTFTASAVDPGDTLAFSLITAPAGAAIDPLAGTFSWTPTEAQSANTYIITVAVIDSGGLFAARNVTITVRPFVHAVNEAVTVTDTIAINGVPLLAPLVDQTVNAGTPVTFTASAVDPGDTLLFSLINGPTGAAIDPLTGVFTWTPTQVGTSSFFVRVTDSGGLFAERAITITVTPSVPAVTVTLTAPDANAAEGTTVDASTFTVTRSGDLTSPLLVQIVVGGSATPGTDFQFSPNVVGTTVTIPAGLIETTITVTPIDDATGEGNETVILTLQPGAYLIGAPASATVTVGDDDLVVTNTDDSGLGSLRQAMLDANAHTGVTDTIRFDIPGAGPHPIAPLSALPAISDPVVIDGTTQPGYVAYQSMVELDGTNAGPNANGLVVHVMSTTVRGLVINRFGAGGAGTGGVGIQLLNANPGLGGGGIVIADNIIGADVSGLTALPNRGAGIEIDSMFGVIGQNLVAFNGDAGITLAGSPASYVVANAIRSNGGAGVAVLSGSGHAIWANSIEGNAGLGIDLGNDGLTPNDVDDADTGPNDFQNFPVLTSALSANGATTVSGTLTSRPNAEFTLHFFVSQACGSSGYGQGTYIFGNTAVTTDAAGLASFDVSIAFPAEFLGQSVTATATASALPLNGTSEFSACQPLNPTITLTPSPLDLLTRDASSLMVTLSYPAGVGGVTVDLTSTDPAVASVPASVVIPEGQVDAAVDVTTGVVAGTTTITASATGFLDSNNAVVDVSLRTMTLASASTLVGLNHPLAGTVTLAEPAPAGGVTVALASADGSIVSVSPPSVTIPQGALTASFTITGVAVGSTTISGTADGFAASSLPMTSTSSALITLGSGVVAPGLETSLALSIGIQAPPGGVTIAFQSSDPSIVSVVTPTVFIPAGLQIPAANPVVHGVAIGTAQITASAVNVALAPDTAPVSVTLSIGLSPSPLTVIEGQTSDLTLLLSAPAPAGGMTFNTTVDNASIATVPPTVHVADGTTSVPVPVTGVAVGSTTVRASAPGIVAAAATVNVDPAPPITVGNATIGKDLEVTLGGQLGAPAPAGNVQVTITSLDPAAVLLSLNATDVGAPSLTLQVGAGQTGIPNFYVQALAGTGTVQLQTTAPGYAPDTSTITLTPSGFAFPISTSPTLTTTTFSSNTGLSIIAARLNADLTVATAQALRGGLTVDVPITSSNPVVGTIVDSFNNQILIDHVTFTAGVAATNAEFDPKEGGTTTIALTQPTGFSTPSHLQQIVATVTASAITVGDATIGKDLEVTLGGQLGAPAPAGNVQVTITSLDPAAVLLSLNATDVGVPNLTLQVTAGQTGIPNFYVQALAGSGTVQLQTTAPGYSPDTSTITLTPSGFAFPLSTSPTLTTTSFSGNTSLGIIAARLNADLTVATAQALRGGLTVDVPITSSNPVVGTIVDSFNDQILIDHVTFTAGVAATSAEFDPKEGGTTTIALTPPAGFSTPSHLQQIVATVTASPITVGDATIGKDLEVTLGGQLGAPAPAGNVQVTITSLDPAAVLLSLSETEVGVPSLTMQVGAGQTGIPSFYVQALAGTGTAQLRTTAPGYSPDTSTITLTPSAFSFALSTSNFSTTTFAGTTTLTVISARLDPATLNVVTAQPIRGGLSNITVGVSSSDTNVGTLVDSIGMSVSSVTFDAADSFKTILFNPAAGGSTTISVAPVAGFSTPNTLRQVTATVTAPNINVNPGAVQVGLDLQVSAQISLGVSPPSRVNVTVTSHSAAIATITTDPLLEGGSTLTFTNVPPTLPGTQVGTIYIQGRSIGTTTLTVQAPGYNDATLTITVHPSGFSYALSTGNITTTTFSTNNTLTVQSMRLDPVTLNAVNAQVLRGGHAPVTLNVTSSNTTVGTIVGSPVVFNANESFKTVQFDPANGGTTTLAIPPPPPTGFSTPSNLQQITATVTAPNMTFNSGSVQVGLDLQVSSLINFSVSPPTRRDVTVTSSNPAVATITTNPLVTGDSTLTFTQVPATLPGTAVGTFYIQGRSIGTTTLTVHADEYNDDTMTVTVHPSGFSYTLSTGNVTTTTFSANNSLSVQPMRLDPVTLNAANPQPLRGGHAPVTVNVTSSNTTVGTIVGSPVVFNANESFKTVQFDPATGGTTTLAIPPPPPTGFSTPSNLQQITATVTAPNMTFNSGSVQVGLDLQVSSLINFSVSPPTRRDVTVTSSNPAVATITTNPLVTGDSTLTFTQVPATLPGTAVGTFYIQGRSIGTTTLTVHADEYNDDTMTVTVHPSGFSYTLSTGNVTTTTFSANNSLSVQPMRLDPVTLNAANPQPLRGGRAPVTVNVTSSNTTVGTIVGSPVVFNANESFKTVQFDPATAGTTTLAIPAPPPTGFTTPSNLQQITATVTAPNINLNPGSAQIGLDLQVSATISFAVSPPTRRDVTVTSNNPAIATITADPLVEGDSTVTFTQVPATLPGTTVGTFFIQGRSLGTTTLTVQALGYNDATLNVTVNPSGFSYTLSTGNITTTTGAANTTLTVQSMRLDPLTLNPTSAQALRGGHAPVSVDVTSSNTTVGTIVGSPVVFSATQLSKTVQFNPATVGTTTLAVAPPAGFSTPINVQQIIATVNP